MSFNNDGYFQGGLEPKRDRNGNVPYRSRSLYVPYRNGVPYNPKKERTLLTKVVIWLWCFAGIPALLSLWISKLGLINMGEVKDFILLTITFVLGVLKIAIMLSEKGDKLLLLFKKIKRKKKKKQEVIDDDTEDFYTK